MLDTLATKSALWAAFIATLLITAAFPIAADTWSLTFIDALSDPAEVRAVIAGMSPTQLVAHAWLTATLDVAYPLAYGALFAGSAICFYPKWGHRLAVVFCVLVATDLLEGVVQVLALTDVVDLIDTKAVLTPLKTLLFLLGVVTTVIGWIMWLVARLKRQPG